MAGFWDVLLFAEPGTELDGHHLPHVEQWPRKLGAYHAWVEAARRTLELRPEADFILMAQDDVMFCKRVHSWALQHGTKGMIQLSTSAKYGGAVMGLTRLADTRRLAGAWACLFSRSALEHVVSYATRKGWMYDRYIDPFIGTALAEGGYPVYCCRPSLVNHVGWTSSMDNGGLEAARMTLDPVPPLADALGYSWKRRGTL